MDVTVAICTWNRSDLLDQTLAAMCELDVPADLEWELFVVNNNCTDATDEVARKYARKLPIRLLHEPTPGKSFALNYAVREARGDYLLWTDDDALVEREWLTSYVEAFRDHPEIDIFGGQVDPWFESKPPAWFAEAWPVIANAFAVRDAGKELSPFTTKWPYGVNLAFRTAAHKNYEYDSDLGRQPGSRIGGEEVNLVKRMLAAGHHGCWLPAAKVRHFIPVKRLTLEYLEQYYYGIGQQRAVEWQKSDQTRPMQSERRLWWDARVYSARYRINRLCRSPRTWARDLKHAFIARGWLDEYRLLRTNRTDISSAANLESAPWR